MPIINITVKNKIAQNPSKEIICGNSDYVIYFDFDEEWAEHNIKTARFSFNDSYIDVVFEGNKVSAPVISNTFTCAVGVFAGDLRTTTPAVIKCQKSILCEGGVPATPTENVYSQLVALCENALSEERIRNIVADELAKANNTASVSKEYVDGIVAEVGQSINYIMENYATKEYVNGLIGKIETVLGGI